MTDQPKPCEMPEEIYIGIDGRWYDNLRPFDQDYRGHRYLRADRTPSPSEEDVREAVEHVRTGMNLKAFPPQAYKALETLIRAATEKPSEEPMIHTAHFRKPMPLSAVLFALAGQENCDGDEANAMQMAGEFIRAALGEKK